MALHTHTFTATASDVAAALAAAEAPPVDLGQTVKLEIYSRGGAGQTSGDGNGKKGGGGGAYAAWDALSLSDLSQCAVETDIVGLVKFVREDLESYNLFDGQSGAAGGLGGYHDESVESPDTTYEGGDGGDGQVLGGGGGGGEGASDSGNGNNGTSGAGGGAGGTGTDGANGGQGGDLFVSTAGSPGVSPGGGGGGGANGGAGGAGGGFEVKLTYTILADETAPEVTITDPTSSATFDTDSEEIEVIASATDAVGIESVTIENDRTTDDPIEMTPEGGDDYSHMVGLFEGENVLTVRAVDAAENEGTDVITITLTSAEMRSGDGIDLSLSNLDTGHVTKALATPDLPENYSLAASTAAANLVKSATTISVPFIRVPLASIPSVSTILEVVLRYSVMAAVAAGTGYKIKLAEEPAHLGRNIYLAILGGVEASDTQTLATGQKTITLNAAAVASLQAAVAAGDTYWYLGLEALTATTLGTISDVVELGISLDSSLPIITVTTPNVASPIFTDEAVFSLSGEVSDNYTVDTVVWRSNRGGGDDVVVDAGEWEVEDIPLAFGLNVISIIATDENGLVQTKRVYVNRTPNGALYPCSWGDGSRRRRRSR